MTLWEIDIHPVDGQPDLLGQQVATDAREIGLCQHLSIEAAYGYLIQGEVDEESIRLASKKLLSDPVTERTVINKAGATELLAGRSTNGEKSATLIHVMRKPGVMDPAANSTLQALLDLQIQVEAVRTLRKFWVRGLSSSDIERLCQKILANQSIEQTVIGPLALKELQIGSTFVFVKQVVPILDLDDAALEKLSKQGQLYLSLTEMKTVQTHFAKIGREPTDIELETVAQTWSEHCSHKTLGGRIEYRDENGTRQFNSMLKETIFAATQKIRAELGKDDWCVSVFKDNAGVVTFDKDYHVVFKVETHNHPSAIEPYGGANTGLGGVIRDPLGTGLGAKPVCSTDVFCFASPDRDAATLPPGVLHPKRVMKGVVAGVRDYGNRMGIPTVNGAVYFDDRYLGNPLVYCGNVGLLPVDKVEKSPKPGDYIVTMGGRTGRDGIHGATFSSVELTEESDSISGGSVQIGNAITEKMVLDVLLQARDAGLYNAVTDCGAGGFSSAVGEMGESMGAEVWLDKAPLKYDGLSYTEIWISEAQERMVLAVSPDQWEAFKTLCNSEGVETAIIGQFVPTGLLRLMYADQEVGCVSMQFLHEGRPPVIRQANYETKPELPIDLALKNQNDIEKTLQSILASPNVASKHWIIRQYDHEVQAGSVIKPLVGPLCDGPSDAAVVRPRLESQRGLVISCGMNPRFGDFDPYHMATSAIDEAVRNAVAVGADPSRIAILDNFCWGNTDRPETLGSLVRAALACHDLAVAWKTPFISGKDSLNNEFAWFDSSGRKQTIAIPSSLLISAIGQVDDVGRCVTMDLKKAGNPIYSLGVTRNELGGSHAAMVRGHSGGAVPKVDAVMAKRIFVGLHQAISSGWVRACHDLSEGGLAVALAEMSFAGGLGIDIDVQALAELMFLDAENLLFSESNSRFVCEVKASDADSFERLMKDLPCVKIGSVSGKDNVLIRTGSTTLVDLSWQSLKTTWRSPLDWE
ncbi:MAG: phosphoribosylformylglycinamidine synthase subunit PurL [Pirellulaceae bacterium]|nr:phosphoribosylformylglycinamidine synthase subunit PurL [Pirellulaceae bacterium]